MTRNSGFTLIETIIYFALFAIIMGGVLTSFYGIMEARGRSQTKITLLNEGSFLLGKFNHELFMARSFIIDGNSLTVYPSDLSDQVIFKDEDLGIELKKGVGEFNKLNSQAVSVLNFRLDDLPASPSTTEGVMISFSLSATTSVGFLDSEAFSFRDYLKQ